MCTFFSNVYILDVAENLSRHCQAGIVNCKVILSMSQIQHCAYCHLQRMIQEPKTFNLTIVHFQLVFGRDKKEGLPGDKVRDMFRVCGQVEIEQSCSECHVAVLKIS